MLDSLVLKKITLLDLMPYTLGQAAKATGITKTTIAEAIKKGRISAIKDDSGRYQIDPSELHRVYKPVSTQDGKADTQNEQYKIHELTAKLMVLEAQVKSIGEIKERIEAECDDLRTDRDKWREQANLALLTHQPKADTQPALPEASTAVRPAVWFALSLAIFAAAATWPLWWPWFTGRN
jgi:excisionase family DNA binding protein